MVMMMMIIMCLFGHELGSMRAACVVQMLMMRISLFGQLGW